MYTVLKTLNLFSIFLFFFHIIEILKVLEDAKLLKNFFKLFEILIEVFSMLCFGFRYSVEVLSVLGFDGDAAYLACCKRRLIRIAIKFKLRTSFKSCKKRRMSFLL